LLGRDRAAFRPILGRGDLHRPMPGLEKTKLLQKQSLYAGGKLKMKRILSAICCVALCSLPALAKKAHSAKAAAAAMTDQQFVDFAAQTDMLEAHLGQMAADQASRQDVKDYAQMLVSDHTSDYQQLSDVAAKANLTVPKGLDDEHNKMIAPMGKLKGAAFDARYIHEMVAGHTKAISVYTKESTDAQNGDLKAYASATLPTLQKHLDGAKDLEKKPAK
jgi:putative membrane protein